jgi:Domain of unknown function (DUF4157)
MHTHDLDPTAIAGSRQGAVRRRDDLGTDLPSALAGRAPELLSVRSVMALQRAVGNAAVSRLLEEEPASPVRDVVGRGGGQPLDPGVRGVMESRLGSDFGDVRIHTDHAASESARGISAQAYTVGSEIVFQSGRYEPQTPAGQRMLAHELTHVVQQRSGPVDGSPAPGGISISDPSDRFEQAAERNADMVMAAQTAAPASAEAAPMAAQRQEEEEEQVQEMPVQQLAVQRQEEEEQQEEQ